MRHKKTIFFTVALAATLVLGAAIGYQSTQKAEAATKTLRVATAGTIYPNAYKNNNKLKGYDVEVANAVAKQMGYKTKWVVTDFDGIFGQVDNEQVDTVANDIGATPERQKKYIFSKPYNVETTNVAVKNSSNYKKIKDLDGKTVATSGAGNNFIKSLKKYDPKVKIKVYETRDQAVLSFANGRVDGLLYSRSSLSALNKKQKLHAHVLKENASSPVQVAYPFKDNAKGKKLRSQFNKAFVKIKKNGQLDKISQKYFDYKVTTELK